MEPIDPKPRRIDTSDPMKDIAEIRDKDGNIVALDCRSLLGIPAPADVAGVALEACRAIAANTGIQPAMVDVDYDDALKACGYGPGAIRSPGCHIGPADEAYLRALKEVRVGFVAKDAASREFSKLAETHGAGEDAPPPTIGDYTLAMWPVCDETAIYAGPAGGHKAGRRNADGKWRLEPMPDNMEAFSGPDGSLMVAIVTDANPADSGDYIDLPTGTTIPDALRRDIRELHCKIIGGRDYDAYHDAELRERIEGVIETGEYPEPATPTEET